MKAWDGDSLGSVKGFSDSGVVSVDRAVVEVKGGRYERGLGGQLGLVCDVRGCGRLV